MSNNEQRINHLYDFYELYSALYSREYSWKAAEARGMSFVMAHTAVRSKKLLAQGKAAINFEKEGFNVLEIFAGRGEHEKHLKLPPELKITRYTHNDLRDHSAECPNFVQGDATTTKFDFGQNFIAALFYTMSSVHDDHGSHNRQLMVKLFKNAYDNLPPGGAFYFDFCSGGYAMSLAVDATDEEDEETEVVVEPDSALRLALGIPYHIGCKIQYRKRSVYDRTTATCIDHFVTPISVIAGARTVATIHIKEPMTQRYYSEPELVDIAREAGFTDFLFFNLDYSDSAFERLENVVETEDGIGHDEVDEYMSNSMVAFR